MEEMLCGETPYGYIYYGEIKHRMKVEFTKEIREKVKNVFEEMHKYYRQCYTPKVKTSSKCKLCSLQDICLPVVNKNRSAASYIQKVLAEGGKE